MNKSYMSLQPSEGLVLSAASRIYAGYIAAGKVNPGDEDAYMQRAMDAALHLAKTLDERIVSDNEMD